MTFSLLPVLVFLQMTVHFKHSTGFASILFTSIGSLLQLPSDAQERSGGV